ncbi:hypothetical protein V8C26DRAFT_321032 [Trichoderma gracile]
MLGITQNCMDALRWPRSTGDLTFASMISASTRHVQPSVAPMWHLRETFMCKAWRWLCGLGRRRGEQKGHGELGRDYTWIVDKERWQRCHFVLMGLQVKGSDDPTGLLFKRPPSISMWMTQEVTPASYSKDLIFASLRISRDLDVTISSPGRSEPLSRIYATATVTCFTTDSCIGFPHHVHPRQQRASLPSWAIDWSDVSQIPADQRATVTRKPFTAS